MAVNLTNHAIPMICSGEYQANDDSRPKPIVQVVDLKLISSANSSAERYRMVISDGLYSQQGMLATQKNHLVHDGNVQKGSIVELTEFVSQLVQNRSIIIIIDLKVIVDKCEQIGDPKLYGQAPGGPTTQSRSPMEQPGVTTGDYQSNGGAPLSSGPSPGQNVNGRAPPHPPRSDSGPQTYGSSISSNPNTGGYGSTVGRPGYPKPEPGSSLPGAAPYVGNYGDQNRNINSSSRPLQPTYQQPTYQQPPYQQPPYQQPPYQQPPYQQPPMYMNRGPTAKNEPPARIIPIAALNPYQGRWTIKARVTAKKELRCYTNARGEGKVFSFNLLDSDGGEIQVTCFNAVVDQFYDQIEAGKVYFISRGSVKPASKKFNHLQNEFEITLDNTSTIQPCMEDDHTIPRQQFHFRPISDIETMDVTSVLDIIGVVTSIYPTQNIMTKNGETQKKTLQLKDMSGRSVELTLWGSICTAEGQELQNMRQSGEFPILAVKAGRVNEFNGKSVGMLSTSQLLIEPDIPDAHRLREWFDLEGKNMPAISISKDSSGTGRVDVRKNVSQIIDEKLGTSEKPDWISVNAAISVIKTETFCYEACPKPVGAGERQCSKKVTNNADGMWRCDKCDESFAECDYRYILQFQISDLTGVTWVTAFQETGEKILGISAKELYYLKHEEQEEEKVLAIAKRVIWNKYMFKLKVKEETFNDEQRVKSTVVSVEKLNYATESRHLLDLIDRHGVSGAVSGSETGMISKGYQNMGSMGQLTAPSIGSSRSPASKDVKPLPANQIGHHVNSYNSAINPGMAGLNSGIPSAGVYISCTSCGTEGHNSNNCPSVMNNRQGQSTQGVYGSRAQPAVGDNACYKCGLSGHLANACPNANAVGARGGGNNVGGGGASGECFKCHQIGHWARDCPGTSSSSSSMYAVRHGGVSNQRAGGF